MFKKYGLLGVIGFSCLTAAAYSSSTFQSEIFKYEDFTSRNSCPRLHVDLEGEGWKAEDIKESHIPFHKSLFGNPKVMKGFADGQTRDAESVEIRCLNSINERFGKGHPHGLLVVTNSEGQPFMHFVAGGGDRAGTSEIAYAMDFDYHGKGWGKKIVPTIVGQWAPEVRRIGLGKGLNPDSEKDQLIQQAFQCFGNETLNQLDATASPSNVASWKLLEGTGFKAASCNVEKEDIVVSFDKKELTNRSILKEQYEAMEQDLLKLFDSSFSPKPLPKAKRFKMVDIQGQERTFSHHDKWDRIKFHFEKKVD